MPDMPVDQLPGPQHDRLPFTVDGHRPVLRVFMILSAATEGGVPIVQLHDFGVHLQPIADFVLRREHGPRVGKRQVGKVVVPHGVVQAERLVAIPPRIAGAIILFNNERRHFQAFQPRRQSDAALSATDNDEVGLSCVTQFCLFLSFSLEPRLPIPEDPVLRAAHACRSRFFLESLEFGHRGQQCPAFPALKRKVTFSRDGGPVNVNQPAVTPFSSVASPTICQPPCCTSEIVAASMAWISSFPSSVLMFQVKEIRSRQ